MALEAVDLFDHIAGDAKLVWARPYFCALGRAQSAHDGDWFNVHFD
jgi:hypothetical protein